MFKEKLIKSTLFAVRWWVVAVVALVAITAHRIGTPVITSGQNVNSAAHSDTVSPLKESDKQPEVKASPAQGSEADANNARRLCMEGRRKITEVRIQPDLAKAQVRQQQNKLIREQDGRINNLQQWLQNERQNIEKWYEDARRRIPEQRQNIENWYQDNLASLQQWRNAELERLNAADRGATARYIQNQNNTISYTDVKSVTNGYISPYGYLSATTSSFGVRSTSVRGDPASQFGCETARVADNRIAIANSFDAELRNLQNQKTHYLNSISENSLQCEKTQTLQAAERYVENASKAAASKKRHIITATEDRLAGGPGVIIDATIRSSGKKSFDCSIDGRFYHQGDTINGFKIQKISASEVIFEKDGKTFARGLQ
jgi:hypothetical protein